jgi:ClpP class serine protease
MPTNKRIDSYLFSGNMPIEEGFAMRELAQYLDDLDKLNSGIEFKELGISKRREASMPKLLTNEGGKYTAEDFKTKNFKAAQIAHFKLEGSMFLSDGLSSRGISSLVEDMRKADASPSVSGILLEVNTGGGELLAGQTLKNAIKDLSKPIMVYAHFMASAGIWGTIHADHIMAAGEGSEFGSIGVYSSVNKRFLDFYKENYIDAYSTKSQDKNKVFRALKDGDTGPLVESVTKADDIFMKDVATNRPLKGKVDETLAGGMFYAKDARRRGLVDSIGTFNDALDQLSKMIRAENRNKMKGKILNFAKEFFGYEGESEEAAMTAIEDGVKKMKENPEEGAEKISEMVTQLSEKIEKLEGKLTSLQDDIQKAADSAIDADQVKEIVTEEMAGHVDSVKEAVL